MFNHIDSILNIFNYIIYTGIIVLNFYLFYKAGKVYTLLLSSAFLIKLTRNILLSDLLSSTSTISFLIFENILLLLAAIVFFKRNYKKKSTKAFIN